MRGSFEPFDHPLCPNRTEFEIWLYPGWLIFILCKSNINVEFGELREFCYLGGNQGRCQVRVFIDGPYGRPVDISGFESCVFIAGMFLGLFFLPSLRC